MEKPLNPLDPEVLALYIDAVLSGNPYHYDPEQEITHPYFREEVTQLSLDQLAMLLHTLELSIKQVEEAYERLKKHIDLEKPLWSVLDSKVYRQARLTRTDLERQWHLRQHLQEIINERMTNVAVRSAKNLRMSVEDLLTLSHQFGQDIVVVLGAGWFGKQEMPEA